MLRIFLLGRVSIEGPQGPLGGAAGQRRLLAIMSVLAVADERGVSRDRLLSLLWPEGDPERARHALTQSLYHLKRALGEEDVIISSGDLRLNPAVITSDVGEFDEALARGERERAVALYHGPFLDGFYVSGSAEFEQWVTAQRERYADRCARALEELALASESAADFKEAVRWRKQLAALDPLNSRVAVQLMTAMAAAGDRAGAIQHARVHEAMLREQLEASPDAAVTALADRLKEESAWSAESAVAIASPPMGDGAASGAAVVDGEEGWEGARVPDVSSSIRGGPPPATRGRVAPTTARPVTSPRRMVLLAALIAALALVVSLIMRRGESDPVPTSIDPDLIAIAPFRVTGADPSLAYLREGMMDLLVTKLSDDGTARIADPGTVMRVWRRAGLSDESDVPLQDALDAARQLGAGQLLTGGIVGTPGRVVISASLLTVPGSETRAQASIEGSADSLTELVDRLAAQLLASEAGELERLASHTSTSLPALRFYLRGQSSLRAGRYSEAIQHFTRAVQRDSMFAMAGLGLAIAADRINALDELRRGLAIAWRARAQLGERDHAYLIAFAGPRYPEPSPAAERLEAWERAAVLAPDRGDVWNELGERLFEDGALLGIRNPHERAAAAFRRATELDPSLPQPYQYLVQLAARVRDTATVRRAFLSFAELDPRSETSDFVGWRAAIALGDAAALDSARARLMTTSTVSLRSIAQSTIYDGLPPDDAERALALMRGRAARAADRVDALRGQHALALNAGRAAAATDVTEDIEDVAPAPRLHLRLRVADALYSVGDPRLAAEAARLLIAGPTGGARVPPDPSARCIAEQWRISRGQLGTARQTIAALRDPTAGGRDEMFACGLLLDAMLAVAERHPDAIRLVERADSALRVGPPLEELRPYATLAVGRLYAALGEEESALAAIRRRTYMRGWAPYRATYLREEGQLAARTGDGDGAIGAYRQYLALREKPDDRVRPQVDSVRADLARLERRRPR